MGNRKNRLSLKTVQSLTHSFFLADQDDVGFHLDFERALRTGGVIKAEDRMPLQPVQNSQNCPCLMLNLPLCRDSQWENHPALPQCFSKDKENPTWAGVRLGMRTRLLMPKPLQSLPPHSTKQAYCDITQTVGHLLGAASHAFRVLTSAWVFLACVGLNNEKIRCIIAPNQP